MATEENKTDTAPTTNKSDADISLPPQEKPSHPQLLMLLKSKLQQPKP